MSDWTDDEEADQGLAQWEVCHHGVCFEDQCEDCEDEIAEHDADESEKA